jgi:hypothetical protein
MRESLAMTARSKRNPRIRKREAIERRAAIAPYVADLQRVPPLVTKQAATLMAILIAARR